MTAPGESPQQACNRLVMLMRSNYPDMRLDVAERAARQQLGLPEPNSDEHLERLEKDEEAHGDRQMQALGFDAIRLSQRRPSKVTAGLPDRRYYHERRGLKLWWEAKTESGVQSPAQKRFQLLCEATDDPYIVGPFRCVEEWLITEGAVRVAGGLLEWAR